MALFHRLRPAPRHMGDRPSARLGVRQQLESPSWPHVQGLGGAVLRSAPHPGVIAETGSSPH
eukprot:6238156-Alexandrium_andersonii.AAC.1